MAHAGLKVSPWDHLGPAVPVAPILVTLAPGVKVDLVGQRRIFGRAAGGPAAALSF